MPTCSCRFGAEGAPGPHPAPGVREGHGRRCVLRPPHGPAVRRLMSPQTRSAGSKHKRARSNSSCPAAHPSLQTSRAPAPRQSPSGTRIHTLRQPGPPVTIRSSLPRTAGPPKLQLQTQLSRMRRSPAAVLLARARTRGPPPPMPPRKPAPRQRSSRPTQRRPKYLQHLLLGWRRTSRFVRCGRRCRPPCAGQAAAPGDRVPETAARPVGSRGARRHGCCQTCSHCSAACRSSPGS